MAKRYTFRPLPCPSYDIEGTESWPEQMAAKGLRLASDGFSVLSGFARFERTEPHETRYRLEARLKERWFSVELREPSAEALELNAAYGWEYVAARGCFYIYRSTRPDAREMNTDPAVQALTLEVLRRRQRLNALSVIFFLFVYPAIVGRFDTIQTAQRFGTPFTLFVLALLAAALWYEAGVVLGFIYTHRYCKKLKRGTPPERRSWRKNSARCLVEWLIRLVATVACMMLLHAPSAEVDRELSVPADPPFATLEDLADTIGCGYEPDELESRGWSTLFAPVNYEWSEDGGWLFSYTDLPAWKFYSVDYHETLTPWMAQILARWLCFYENWFGGMGDTHTVSEPDVGADYAVAFDPTAERDARQIVIVAVDNVVVRASLDGVRIEPDPLPTDELARAIADSIR